MKKARFLTLVLAVAVMMMGAGYAYWTDTLTINNTVSTGELNVRFISANAVATDDGEYVETEVSPDFASVGTDDDTNALTLAMNNFYPGASARFTATMENDGTIPVILHEVVVGSVSTDVPDLSKFLVNGTITTTGGYTSTIETSHGVTLANLQAALNHDDIRLEPGKTLTFDLTLTLDPTVGDDFEDKSYSSVLTMNFKQHNAN